MAATAEFLRSQLEERHRRLRAALQHDSHNDALGHLLSEVDMALQHMDQGTYGLCEVCHDPVESDRLLADPLVCYCLDHLSDKEKRAMEADIQAAVRIQRTLLPPYHISHGSWQVHYQYHPAGPISGDYCDFIRPQNADGELILLLGDIAGKGIAASLLMAHLHAMLRTLANLAVPLHLAFTQANRLFAESTMASQFATLIGAKVSAAGQVELCSAGHCPAFLISKNGTQRIDATGLPLGMFSTTEYSSIKLSADPGDTLVFYTDGISEARDSAGVEYGLERLAAHLGEYRSLAPEALSAACLESLHAFSGGAPQADDVTVMVAQRAAQQRAQQHAV